MDPRIFEEEVSRFWRRFSSWAFLVSPFREILFLSLQEIGDLFLEFEEYCIPFVPVLADFLSSYFYIIIV